MGINIKKLAKQNRLKNASDLEKKIRFNQVVHAINESMFKGKVMKRAIKDKCGNVSWVWGLSEWMDDGGNFLDQYKPK